MKKERQLSEPQASFVLLFFMHLADFAGLRVPAPETEPQKENPAYASLNEKINKKPKKTS